VETAHYRGENTVFCPFFSRKLLFSRSSANAAEGRGLRMEFDEGDY
jgi:hypothetical protein